MSKRERIIHEAFRIAIEDTSIDVFGTQREINEARAIAERAPDMLAVLVRISRMVDIEKASELARITVAKVSPRASQCLGKERRRGS